MLHRDTLNTTHPDHDRELIADYRALYAGGKAFRQRIARFLPQNDREPDALYELRKKSARYRSYLGPIINYFAAYLLSSPFTPRPSQDGTPVQNVDPWYASFKEDCDGAGTDLDAFMRLRVIDALVGRRAWWRLELPSDGGTKPTSREEWATRGLGSVRLHEELAENILDWRVSEVDQRLDYVITYSVNIERKDPKKPRGTLHHEWRIYDRQMLEVYAVDVAKGESFPQEIPLISSEAHGFADVPYACLDVEDGLWIANQVADAQQEHFAMSAGLGWSIRRTCYAMPVFKIKPSHDASQPNGPTMGNGYYLVIGDEDDMVWSAPPAAPFAVIASEVKAQKDEIYRIVNQMALGVDNNAAAVGRSGDSKLADAEAVKIILTALGETVRGAIERTYDMVSAVREDCVTWAIEGLNVYDRVDVGPLAEAIAEALAIGVPSPTFHREAKTRLALALVGGRDQKTKDAIREEVERNITDESVLAPVAKAKPVVPKGSMDKNADQPEVID